ncbi:hypothetical protein J2S43_000594 [Catenuloplanes nepalensis]|uniref:DUF742 domain-containing protein n=1 Tax=Catenuloplanes nepalensis TaxID=587533 RepID=A0ABT9MKY6_9ACTN|nr:DUF742 domain-containing protein [Catenuloplanes nepalensis]MDP9792082.1 hypothetical protein [Catenuloplanes nepalensis]
MNGDPEAGLRMPDPRMFPKWQQEVRPARDRTDDHVGGHRADNGSSEAEDPVVRPFLVTGGRTRPLADNIRIETLFFAQPAALSAPLRFEAERIVQLCQAPMSLADLAAALRTPLGVTRVLVGDLIAEKYIQVSEQTNELSIELIERIRDRVRAL